MPRKKKKTEQKTPSCAGCGGGCHNCSGEVLKTKNPGRPRKFCCLNCKSRKGNRDYYRRNYQTQTAEVERRNVMQDFTKMIDGHKQKGHEGQRCPSAQNSAGCLELATIVDDMRDSRGLNRMYVQMYQERN